MVKITHWIFKGNENVHILETSKVHYATNFLIPLALTLKYPQAN